MDARQHRAGAQVLRERDHRDLVESVLNDEERLPLEQQPVAARDARRRPWCRSSIWSVAPVAGLTVNSRPGPLWTTTSVLPFFVASMPFRLKPAPCSGGYPGERERLDRAEDAARADRDLEQHRLERVGEVRHPSSRRRR